ncbi:hypothetical protein BGZ63DRAFT_135921 [Mariannaea sp. PMI_226]|nr:hypothetical protein BGZ63DRAFT_135921 [Mariannaea sp. PMI_226]
MATARPSSSQVLSISSSNSTLATSQPPTSLPKQHRRRRIYRPKKNSLYDLFHQHSGTSLFLPPILWLDLHAQLLGAQWAELPACDAPKPTMLPGSPPSQGHMKPSATIITLSDALTQILLPDLMNDILCTNAIMTILATLWPEPFGKPQDVPKLHLYFGGRVYRDSVRSQIMWDFPSDGTKSSYSYFRSVSTRTADSFNPSPLPSTPSPTRTNRPMMCYIGKNHLATIRQNLFRVPQGPGGSWNEPVSRLQELRQRQILPANTNQDPYFVGLFLAMAQKYYYPAPHTSLARDSPIDPNGGIPPSPNFQDITLRILTHDKDTSDFIVYTGYITPTFLEKFHNPFNASLNDDGAAKSGIRIEYARVPIWPILGLRERLGKALGYEVVGKFDINQIETWEKDPENQVTRKREHDTLSEALSGSLKEDSDEPGPIGKKRCISEGSPLGVAVG